jgi:hypothetical protein
MGTSVRRTAATGLLAAVVMCASAAPATAAVTIGQTGPIVGLCSTNQDWAQQTVSTGNPYVVPSIPPARALTITSWSHLAYTSPDQKLKFKVYRPVSGLTYTVVGHDLRNLNPSVLNTFETEITVQPGDILGITNASDSASTNTGCGINAFGETDLESPTDTPLGGQVTFGNSVGAAPLDISAVVEPTNTFTLGQATRNKKKGTATLMLQVPNLGELSISGSGATASAGSKSVSPGNVGLTIRATGKKRKKLNRTGKVKLAPSITYTPTGGSASTQATKLKLKKRL